MEYNKNAEKWAFLHVFERIFIPFFDFESLALRHQQKSGQALDSQGLVRFFVSVLKGARFFSGL